MAAASEQVSLWVVPEYQSKDPLIDMIRDLNFKLASVDRAMSEVETMIEEHRKESKSSRLSRLLGQQVGKFFTPLRLVDALNEYDSQYALKARKFIPPSFSEIRHILNLAQLRSICKSLKLITFDADGTIYDDGTNLEKDNPMLNIINTLLEMGIYVAIVTAAGYPRDPTSYEKRFSALIEGFKERKEKSDVLSRFFVIGGESNYLFKMAPLKEGQVSVDGSEYRLEFVPDKNWMIEDFLAIQNEDMQAFLDQALQSLESNVHKLKLTHRFKFVRKERAIGLLRVDNNWVPRKEPLDELAFGIQERLKSSSIPFCAFNSGRDVWVDIGHKSIGVQSLMKYLSLSAHEVLHVGDQMSKTGNDFRARDACCTLWVGNPKETRHLLRLLINARQPPPQQ